MKVTFLRHAQSIFNRDFTSEKDCCLSEQGVQDAKEITGTYDIIICSTMKRAKETLQHSQLSSKKLYFTDLCREYKLDICDFLEDEDHTQKESHEELEKRMRLFKQYLHEKVEPGKSVLVICHRDFIYEIGKKRYPLARNCEFQTIQLE
jgi:broad specificity phosphatase PhoE